MINTCQVCGASPLTSWNQIYKSCPECGHHSADKLLPATIINEALILGSMNKRDILDRFKSKTLRRYMKDNACLIDVGSGSGKFIYQNKNLLKASIGIEVSPLCIEFSKNILDLKIMDDYPLEPQASVVTFWHSLEHLHFQEIKNTLAKIEKNSLPSLRLIISVPNSQSYLHRWLKENDPYYDSTSHLHEFSFLSLCHILKLSGFESEVTLSSFAYSLFGWIQGLSNIFHPVRNYWYYRFRRDNMIEKTIFRDFYAVVLMAVMLLPGIFFVIGDLLQPHKACVLNVIAKKFS